MSAAAEVILVGEALMVLNGPADRPIDRNAALQATLAGAEMNVAIGLARLGHRARWLSVLGDDLFGQIIIRTLRGEGVDVSCVQTCSGAPTAMMIKNRRAGGEPEVFYYRTGSAISCANAGTFAPDTLHNARVLYLSGITPALSAGCREMAFHLAREAKRCGMDVWVDPNYRRKLWSEADARTCLLELLGFCSVALVGIGEGRMLTGASDPATIASAIADKGVPHVIVKAGPEGALYRGPTDTMLLPGFTIAKMIDPIGAGDGFAAGVLSARLEGLAWHDAIRRGHAVGAMVCLTQGDWEGLPTRRELEDFLSHRSESIR